MEEEVCVIHNVPSRMTANHKRLKKDFKTFAASLKTVFVEERGTCSIVFEAPVQDNRIWYEYMIQQHNQAVTLNKQAGIPEVKWFSFAEPMIMELLNMLLSFLRYSDRYKRLHWSLLSNVFFREGGKSHVLLESDDQKYSMENFLGNLEEVMLFMYDVANKLNSLLLLGSSRIDVPRNNTSKPMFQSTSPPSSTTFAIEIMQSISSVYLWISLRVGRRIGRSATCTTSTIIS